MLNRGVIGLVGLAAMVLGVGAAKPLLPASLLPLSERDTTTGESGCESAFTQGNKSFVFVQNATLILRTAPGATGRKLCRLTQAQQSDFGSGPTTASCGGLRLSIRPIGRGTANEASDSTEGPAALTLSDGAHSRVVRGVYGTAC